MWRERKRKLICSKLLIVHLRGLKNGKIGLEARTVIWEGEKLEGVRVGTRKMIDNKRGKRMTPLENQEG